METLLYLKSPLVVVPLAVVVEKLNCKPPLSPCDPVYPITPCDPVNPILPCDPVYPNEPVYPITPCDPV